MRGPRSLLLLAAFASLVLDIAVVEAARKTTPPKAEPVYRSFDGKPIAHSCRAEVGDLEGLKAALIAHARALIGFKEKLRSGVYSVPKSAQTHLNTLPPQTILDTIRQKLHRIDGSRDGADRDVRSVALIYDTGVAEGQYSVCVWLISPDGLEAAASVPLPPQAFAELVRDDLGVTARAAARAPSPRRNAPSKAREKRQSVAATPPADPSAAADHPEPRSTTITLADAADVLLPPAIRETLSAAHNFNRVVILPAADLGTVPFAALPLGDRPLIGQAAVVILPDVAALLASDENPHSYAATLAELKPLVIGNPDLSQDPEWVFQSLPGAELEANRVAQIGEAVPLIGARATRGNVLNAFSDRPELIYFATHGISDGVNPMDGSFLALRNGHLFARDIKGLRRFYGSEAHPLVVMSACQTGLGKVFEGGVFGLARAWHHAGAWQVVMSLWNVDDDATAALMTRFMTYHAAGRRFRQDPLQKLGLEKAMKVVTDPAWKASRHQAFELVSERNQMLPGRFFDKPRHGAEFDLQAAVLASRKDNLDPALWAGFVLYGLPTMQRN